MSLFLNFLLPTNFSSFEFYVLKILRSNLGEGCMQVDPITSCSFLQICCFFAT